MPDSENNYVFSTGEYLAERITMLSARFDFGDYIRKVLLRVDATLHRAAKSQLLEAMGGFSVFMSTIAMLLDHEFYSPVGNYWASERYTFEFLLLYICLQPYSLRE